MKVHKSVEQSKVLLAESNIELFARIRSETGLKAETYQMLVPFSVKEPLPICKCPFGHHQPVIEFSNFQWILSASY